MSTELLDALRVLQGIGGVRFLGTGAMVDSLGRPVLQVSGEASQARAVGEALEYLFNHGFDALMLPSGEGVMVSATDGELREQGIQVPDVGVVEGGVPSVWDTGSEPIPDPEPTPIPDPEPTPIPDPEPTPAPEKRRRGK